MRTIMIKKEILEVGDKVMVSHTFQYNRDAGSIGVLIGIDKSGFKPYIVKLDDEEIKCFYESELEYKD
ncbi:hypothetical protein DRO61_05690 [Candidatus Bathyarchaeota archaeon]|nr:MAG: hypothetical protein DRO61_05690 [Candidatus Bathyarchaeota archaeon]